jgi:hypothetical protein
VLFGTDDNDVPRLVNDLELYSVKMHLSNETYARMGGHDGSRVLNMNDCVMASVFSNVARTLAKQIPLLHIQGEDTTICARLSPKKNGEAVEIGAIFRDLPPEQSVPGFVLFSKTRERLPHLQDSAAAGVVAARMPRAAERLPAEDALRFFMDKHPGLSKAEAFTSLFASPVLDVVFGLYAQGASLEMHPQNFSLSFNAQTGAVDKVWARDLHGINYDANWRAQHGQPDVCSVASLQNAFPDLTQEDLNGWFTRPHLITGKPEFRDRYRAPDFMARNFDVYIAVFFYQVLTSLQQSGFMSPLDVDAALIHVRDDVERAAGAVGFDLKNLEQGGFDRMTPTMKVAFSSGMRGRVLFRRPSDKAERQRYISEHEAPVLQAVAARQP